MHFHSHHDYIIIGSGSSGAVVCNRLIKAGYSVLLLEAGPDDSNPILHMPGGTQEILRNKKYNWQIETEPQTALNNRTLLQHRGKVLGGSSNLNGMVAIRGNSACYDHWAELGNDGWAYQDVLKILKPLKTAPPAASIIMVKMVNCPSAKPKVKTSSLIALSPPGKSWACR